MGAPLRHVDRGPQDIAGVAVAVKAQGLNRLFQCDLDKLQRLFGHPLPGRSELGGHMFTQQTLDRLVSIGIDAQRRTMVKRLARADLVYSG